MARYFTRPCKATGAPRAGWDDDYPLLPPVSVPDHEPTDTGLLDSNGDPIMRAPRPIGFGRDDEW